MGTIANRIKQFAASKGFKLKDIADLVGEKEGTFRQSLNRHSIKDEYINKICIEYGLSKHWLLTGDGAMYKEDINAANEPAIEYAPESVKVNDPFIIETWENSFGNRFISLPNSEFIMTMPFFDYEAQGGFLDVYQDVEEMKRMHQHTITVPKQAQGRYVAFRVTGSSMDNGTSESIQHGNIVSTRELKRELWSYKLKFNEFPYWVIFTTKASTPILKQIIEHDTENGILTCHSLNDAPQFSDFTLSLNDVQGLFYVIEVTREFADKEY